MNLYQFALKERDSLLSRIKELEDGLQGAPEGVLTCYRNGKSQKLFQQISRPDLPNRIERHYIPSAKKDFARSLAKKTCQWYDLLDAKEELRAVESYLRLHKSDISRKEKRLKKRSGLLQLLREQQKPLPDKNAIDEWQNALFESNPSFQQNLTIKTIRGEYVRSKSESLIAMMLYNHNIPYRYDCALELGSEKIYPDFTILHPVTKQIILWEHFGMIDDPRYLKTKFEYKIELYVPHGYIPFHNLIMTFETKDHAFDVQIADTLINHYFL